MNAENSTGNPARLPLAERALQGLLLLEPALPLVDVLALEHPFDRAARLALGAALRAAVNFGDLPVSREQRNAQILRKESTWLDGAWTLGAGDPPTRTRIETQSTVVEYVAREDYRRWRAQCPATLLSDLSQIGKWLGEAPAIIPARMPLAERARTGALLSEPTLLLSEVLELEHPGDRAAQAALQAAIDTALRYGGLHSSLSAAADGCLPGDEFLERESYQRWRGQCPTGLLSALSQISKWLGATPMLESLLEPSLPESLPELHKRSIALVEAENAALVALRKALKREPDFEEFWDYLTTKDETGTIADCTDSRLDWIGKSEKACSTAKRTIRNRLTAAKKRNPFTPS